MSIDSRLGLAAPEFGQRNGKQRYHMPLLPGERGTKAGGDYVPYGLQSATNLAASISDTKALAVHLEALTLIGLILDRALREELYDLVTRAIVEGVDFERLRDHPKLRDLLAGDMYDRDSQDRSIAGRAREAAKANAAARRGTAAHDAWHARAVHGEMTGDATSQMVVMRTEVLLEEAGLQRVPGLQERVVRNLEVKAAGRFDDILLEQSTGRLLMADLKTKVRPWFSMLEVDCQLAIYAYSRWMLTIDGQGYEPGPNHSAIGVDMTTGVILHVPSDGAPARLEPANLIAGWETAKLARKVCDQRSAAKNVQRMPSGEAMPWTPGFSFGS